MFIVLSSTAKREFTRVTRMNVSRHDVAYRPDIHSTPFVLLLSNKAHLTVPRRVEG